MPSETSAEAAGRLLRERQQRAPFRTLDAERRGDFAYADEVQDFLLAGLGLVGSQIAGWKVGLTSAAAQAACGTQEPALGAFGAGVIYRSGATLSRDQFTALRIEPELAVRIGSLPAADVDITRETAAQMVDQACAAFELIDDRGADLASLDAASLIADNVWNAGVVLGEPLALVAGERLTGRSAELAVDDLAPRVGLTEHAGAAPFETLAWTVNTLRRRGRALEVGQWVMTGSILPPFGAISGTTCRFAVDGFAPVALKVI